MKHKELTVTLLLIVSFLTLTAQTRCDSVLLTHDTTINMGDALASLQFSINGQTIGSVFNSPPQTATWERFCQPWNSGNNTQAVIKIINQNIEEGGGNDFALDDISFSPLLPCFDSVTVAIDFPLDARPDEVRACRGSTQTCSPLQNDIIDPYCNGLQPEIIQQPTHANAQVSNTDITINFDPTFTGTETMKYRICCGGKCDTAEIILITSGKNGEMFEQACDRYIWNGQTYSQSGAYTHRYISADGCDSIVTLYLTIDDCTIPVYFPSAISPSIADGHNDRLSLPDIAKPQMEEFKIRIFDRWGNLVFYSEDKDFVWDGTRNGKLLPNSVYVYELRYKTALEEDYKILTGTITVL